MTVETHFHSNVTTVTDRGTGLEYKSAGHNEYFLNLLR